MHKFSSPTRHQPRRVLCSRSVSNNGTAVMNTESPPMSNSRCQSNPSPSPILPDDLIIEILSLLKVKLLMKMKCVSKTWNTLISNPTFVKMHLSRSSQNSHSYLVTYSNSKQMDYCSFVPFSVNALQQNRSINLPSDPYYRLIDKDCREVVGSCNGLVCLLGYSLTEDGDGYKETWLRLWNPATRTISDKFGYFCDDMYQLNKSWKFTFGYDNSTDTYKVVALHKGGGSTTGVQVLSFGNNVWRNIQRFSARLLMLLYYYNRGYGGVHLDCTVNWMATIDNGNRRDTQSVIISLDLSTETHTQLLPPSGPSGSRRPHPSTGVFVLMESLCFYHDFKGSGFVILWKMTKFGDEKWTQFLKLKYLNLQMKFTYDLFRTSLYVNGDTLVLIQEPQDRVILYNWRNRKVVKTRVNENICWFSINNYVESLVSTC